MLPRPAIRSALAALAATLACCGPAPAPRPPPLAPAARTTQPAPPASPEVLALLRDIHGAGSAPVEPFHVVGNIYYVGSTGVASYLIVTPDGDILLDTGTREMIPQVPANIARLGFRVSDIKILLTGHAHEDHVQGHAAMQRATGARVMAMAGDAETLEAGGEPSASADDRWDPVHVDRVLHDGDTVSLGGTTMTAVWAPGHTPGCTVWTTTVTEHARHYAVAFYACPGPNGETPLFDNPRFPDIVERSLDSFRKLLRLRPDIYLMMHPWDQFLASKVDRIKAGETPHPLDDPRAWIQALEDDRADLEQRIAAEQARRGAAGPSLLSPSR